eukprot:1201774-Pyramimonas_sp.AAC.1
MAFGPACGEPRREYGPMATAMYQAWRLGHLEGSCEMGQRASPLTPTSCGCLERRACFLR